MNVFVCNLGRVFILFVARVLSIFLSEARVDFVNLVFPRRAFYHIAVFFPVYVSRFMDSVTNFSVIPSVFDIRV